MLPLQKASWLAILFFARILSSLTAVEGVQRKLAALVSNAPLLGGFFQLCGNMLSPSGGQPQVLGM